MQDFSINLSLPIVIDFVIYAVAMLAIGAYFYHRNQNSHDYFIGGKSLGPVVSALSAGASDMSGWLLMGLPGAIIVAGLGQSYIAIGLCCGALLNWLFIARRLRIYTDIQPDCITIADYFESRFDDKSHALRIICAVVILVFFTIYICSALVAGAKLFHSLFAIDYQTALLIGTALIVAYTFLGGYYAVCWTDLVQGILMMAALIIIPGAMLYHIGSVDEALQIIDKVSAQKGVEFASMSTQLGAMGIISALAWGLGYFGQPHILIRFMSIRSIREIPCATAIGISWMAISLAGAVLMGFFAIAYLDKFHTQLADPERIFIAMSQILFNPWICGVLLSAILAAIMSTASSQLLVSSSTLAEDFYRKIYRRDASNRTTMLLARASVIAVAAVAFFISRDANASILNIVAYAWAGFGASFGSVLLVSLFYSRASCLGAILGMCAGALVVIIWENLELFGIERSGIFTLYSIVPGFGASVVCIFIGSWLKPASTYNQGVFRQMLDNLK